MKEKESTFNTIVLTLQGVIADGDLDLQLGPRIVDLRARNTPRSVLQLTTVNGVNHSHVRSFQ